MSSTSSTNHPARKLRGFIAGAALAAMALIVPTAQASVNENQPGWHSTTRTLETGINNGYELALDPVNRTVYAGDAHWRVETKVPVLDASGAPTGNYYLNTVPSTAKVVAISSATNRFQKTYSYLGLTKVGGGLGSSALDWTGVTGSSNNTMRTAHVPYGVAVDSKTTTVDPLTSAVRNDPTIITTTARSRPPSVHLYNASQSAPADSGVITYLTDTSGNQILDGSGDPIEAFDGVRRVAVDTQRNKAYVTNFGGARGGGSNPGFIAVVDTQSKPWRVEARIEIPGGAIGATVDEGNNLIYVGSMANTSLYVIDGSKINTSNPASFAINNAAVVKEIPGAEGNSRPAYDPTLKRVYSSNYDARTISVIDADPASATFQTVIHTIEAGRTNSVAIDGERGLVYSADLQDRVVSVIKADTHEIVYTVPTSADAVKMGIDPVSRDLYVSNYKGAGLPSEDGVSRIDVISVKHESELPVGPEGPAGKDGKDGKNGTNGKNAAGANSLRINVASVKNVARKVQVRAPGAGVIKANLKAGKRTVAAATVRVNKAGKRNFALRPTKVGKKLLKKKKAVRGVLTVSFSPNAKKAASSQSTVKAAIRR